MVLLGEIEVFDLVWNGVVWVIGQIRTGFIGGGVGGGALPAGDIDGVEVFGHHGDLDWVQSAKGSRRCAIGLVGFESGPELLSELV